MIKHRRAPLNQGKVWACPHTHNTHSRPHSIKPISLQWESEGSWVMNRSDTTTCQGVRCAAWCFRLRLKLNMPSLEGEIAGERSPRESECPTAISLITAAIKSGWALQGDDSGHESWRDARVLKCGRLSLLTYLLLRILHPAHAHLAPPLHAHWVSVWWRWSVRLARWIRPAPWLLGGWVGIVGHAVQLGALHSHELHGGHLWREKEGLTIRHLHFFLGQYLAFAHGGIPWLAERRLNEFLCNLPSWNPWQKST